MNPGGHSDNHPYPLPVAARLAGLSPATLRMWTRRYEDFVGVVEVSGRRVFSEADIGRLRTLRLLTDRGLRIGDLAGLPEDDLTRLLSDTPQHTSAPDQQRTLPGRVLQDQTEDFSLDDALTGALTAVENYNPRALREKVDAALVALGRLRFADGFLFPLVKESQSRLVDGRLRPIHQTFLVSQLAAELAGMLATGAYEPYRRTPAAGHYDPTGPAVVVASPGGVGAELGCLASAVHVAAAGLTPIYVGTGMPGEDLVDAVRRCGAVALVLSVVRPSFDQRLLADMVALRRRLPGNTSVYVGGRFPQDFKNALTAAGLEIVPDMTSLSQVLHLLKSEAG